MKSSWKIQNLVFLKNPGNSCRNLEKAKFPGIPDDPGDPAWVFILILSLTVVVGGSSQICEKNARWKTQLFRVKLEK